MCTHVIVGEVRVAGGARWSGQTLQTWRAVSAGIALWANHALGALSSHVASVALFASLARGTSLPRRTGQTLEFTTKLSAFCV
jgi:hypothetical protein